MTFVLLLVLLISGAALFINWRNLSARSTEDDICPEDCNGNGCDSEECYYPDYIEDGCSGPDDEK